MLALMVAASMLAMQEQMQHWAQEQQQKRQHTPRMGPVFGHDEERGNGEKNKEHWARRRPDPTPSPRSLLHGHL